MAAVAGSRTHKIGSVFNRCGGAGPHLEGAPGSPVSAAPELSPFFPRRARNLVRIGLLEKPVWLDVYAAFPPLREPVYRVARPRYGRARDPIAPIFYREDTVRA